MSYIERDALGVGFCNPGVFDDKGYAKGWNAVIDIINTAPAVDVAPVVRGKWIEDWETGCSECSNCHDTFLWEDFKGVADWRYCPTCGARMSQEGEG